LFAAGSPDYIELALVFADSLPTPTAPGFEPNDLLTKIGVSYFTSENPLVDYMSVCFLIKFSDLSELFWQTGLCMIAIKFDSLRSNCS